MVFAGRKAFAVLIALLPALGCTGEAYEDTDEIVESVGDTSALEVPVPDAADPWALALEASRDSILMGEPVYLVVRLVNQSNETRGVPDLLSPEFGFLQISIRRPGADQWSSYDPPVLLEGRGAEIREVPHDSSISTVVPIFFERDGWVFDEAGTYEFRGSFWWEELHAESAPAEIRVASPADEREREAARRFISAGRFVYLGGGAEADAVELVRLAESSAETAIGNYARVALAVASEGKGGTDCERVRALLLGTLPQVADPIVAADGYRVLAGCMKSVGRAGEAEVILDGYRRRHGKSDVLPEALDRLEGERR